MALRLVRQTSDTPNITNKDDTIMTRYAYGGYSGIVKGFGSECEYTAENGIFKILDGEIIIDGWEIQIDGAGWSLNLSSLTGTQYHSVYAEINVLTETVILNSTYLTGSYPEIEKGDDLTETPNGTARLLLYNVKVENGAITEVVKKFEIIPYLTQKVLDIEQRLEKLGFKSLPYIRHDILVTGAQDKDNEKANVGYISIQGGKSDTFSGSYRIGNTVKISGNIYIDMQYPFKEYDPYYQIFAANNSQLVTMLPEEFRPKEDLTFYLGYARGLIQFSQAFGAYDGKPINSAIRLQINSVAGQVLLDFVPIDTSFLDVFYEGTLNYSSFNFNIGYDVSPITK